MNLHELARQYLDKTALLKSLEEERKRAEAAERVVGNEVSEAMNALRQAVEAESPDRKPVLIELGERRVLVAIWLLPTFSGGYWVFYEADLR